MVTLIIVVLCVSLSLFILKHVTIFGYRLVNTVDLEEENPEKEKVHKCGSEWEKWTIHKGFKTVEMAGIFKEYRVDFQERKCSGCGMTQRIAAEVYILDEKDKK